MSAPRGSARRRLGGQTRNQLAAVDATTGLATAWDPSPDGYAVHTLGVCGNTVYAGGHFTRIVGQPRNNLAALDATSGLASAWDPNVNHDVYALAVSGNTVYAGGDFDSIGGQPRSNLAALDATTGAGGRYFLRAWDATSGLATDWNPTVNAYVRALAVGGGTVYVGGDFTNIGGQPRYCLAALDATSALVTGWNPAPGPYSSVAAVALNAGTVYVGGSFFNGIGGQPWRNLAALDATSGLASSWHPDPDGSVFALSAKGTTLCAVGSFTNVGGSSHSGIVGFRDLPTAILTERSAGPTSGISRVAPNPASEATRIEYVVARPERVRLSIVDIAGPGDRRSGDGRPAGGALHGGVERTDGQNSGRGGPLLRTVGIARPIDDRAGGVGSLTKRP